MTLVSHQRTFLGFAAALLCLCLLLFFGCQPGNPHGKVSQWFAAKGKIKVLTTIAMIEDLVQEVGGDKVATLTLVTGELDPHTYQLVKGDDEKLEAAEVIFYNGLGLEHGPSLRNYLYESQRAVSLGDAIRQQFPELILNYNGSVDPHLWMDAALWAKTVDPIVEALAAADPANALEYRENGDNLKEKLGNLHQELIRHMAAVPSDKRYLITSHDAFNYFARAYLATADERRNGGWQKRFAAPEGLAPESQLSTEDIRYILSHMKEYGIQVIFPESNVSKASLYKLQHAGRQMGIHVMIVPEHLFGDAMGPPGSSGENYFMMLKHNVNTIVKYLAGP